jgi:hypothetical protein
MKTMKRLEYSQETHDLLLEIAEEGSCYWRYQGSHHNGLIPVGHKSNERIFEGEEPEFEEEGCSCYDNPWQLLEYLAIDGQDLDKTDVVLFVGDHVGYGIVEEDVVEVTEEDAVMYSLSLRDFYKFAFNVPEDLYWNTYNVKEKFCDYTEEFMQEVFSK